MIFVLIVVIIFNICSDSDADNVTCRFGCIFHEPLGKIYDGNNVLALVV